MSDNSIVILDTTVAEAGPTQFSRDNFLKKDVPLRMVCDLASGDTVLIEGADTSATADFVTLHTFDAAGAADVYVSRFWRARRSVDGTSGDSTVTVQNTHNQKLEAHE